MDHWLRLCLAACTILRKWSRNTHLPDAVVASCRRKSTKSAHTILPFYNSPHVSRFPSTHRLSVSPDGVDSNAQTLHRALEFDVTPNVSAGIEDLLQNRLVSSSLVLLSGQRFRNLAFRLHLARVTLSFIPNLSSRMRH